MSIKIIPSQSDEVNCPITLEPYVNPVVLVDCGHTLSEPYGALVQKCPICNTPVTSRPVANYALRDVMSTMGETLPVLEVYELFCIDISTSMWYSDLFGPLSIFFGISRIDIAKQFCSLISVERQKDDSHKMGLISFGSNVSIAVDYGTPRNFRNALSTLSPTESRTRVFDAYEECVSHLSTKSNCQVRLYMMTDGGDNFSSAQNSSKFQDRLKSITETTKRLKIATFVFNVGGNVDNARRMADIFGAEFKHIDSDNFKSLATNMCKVSFPNREQQILNLFQKVPAIPSQSIVVVNKNAAEITFTPQRNAANV